MSPPRITGQIEVSRRAGGLENRTSLIIRRWYVSRRAGGLEIEFTVQSFNL